MTESDDRVEALALALLEDALGEPEQDRHAFVAARPQTSAAVRDRTLALLNASSDGSSMTGAGLSLAADDAAPAEIGSYRIEREIGRGGMGAVYLGRSKSGDFDHVAAIKIVRRTGRPADLIARLRAERRLLAQLKHPNIAQLYDGGETPDGAPYFIMEYVDGAPLSRWLAGAPPLKDRLQVFRGVCDAVAYAHRNLVVHRDLSAANILVSADGLAKLIDFGISQPVGDASDQPGSGLTMTKGYAAPERREGAAATTLADVYSLGVLLGEILTGAPAPRRSDLDAIAARARAEAPEARYGSVEALIADLTRYERKEPVEAVNGGWAYAASRFAGRRRWAVTAAAAALAGIIGTSVVTSLLYLRATSAEREARQQFQSVRDLAKFMVFDLHDEIAKVPGSTTARMRLADTGRRYLDALSASGSADASLRVETAIGYKRLGDVVGNASGGNLGRRAEAGQLLKTAHAQLAALSIERPADADVARAFAETALGLSVYHFIISDNTDAAIASALEAETIIRKLIKSGEAMPADRLLSAKAQIQRGVALVWNDKGEAAIALIEGAIATIDALVADHPDNEEFLIAQAQASVDLGDTMSRHLDQRGGDQAPALARLDDGVARYAALIAKGGADLDLQRGRIVALWKRALVSYAMENDDASLKDLAAASDLLAPLIERDAEDMGLFRLKLSLLSQQALSLGYLGRGKEAITLTEENLAGRRRLIAMEPENPALKRELASALRVMAEARQEAGDASGACKDLREALRVINALGEAEANVYFNGQTGKAIREAAGTCG